jgi:NAD-dependent deacetylase
LWNVANPLQVASIYAFRLRPQMFYDWIRPLAKTFYDAIPNPAHQALAELERMGKLEAIVTQNVDALHEVAGSRNVIEVHGSMREATCVRCKRVVAAESILPRLVASTEIPYCEQCGGVLKPNVVLYGEQLPTQAIDAARRAARTCDLMLVAGTSLQITPAADLPRMALENRARVIVVNQQPTAIDHRAAAVIRADVASALPAIVERVRTLAEAHRAGPGPRASVAARAQP